MSPRSHSSELSLIQSFSVSDGAGGIHGLKDDEEDIRVFACPLSEALGRIQSGGIANFTAVVALQWLALNKERLQREWASYTKGR